jgi:hypothetical protein
VPEGENPGVVGAAEGRLKSGADGALEGRSGELGIGKGCPGRGAAKGEGGAEIDGAGGNGEGGRGPAAKGALGRSGAAGAAGGAAEAAGWPSQLPTTPFTLSINPWLSNGLTMWPSAPAARARPSSNGSKLPLRRSTGIDWVEGSDLSASQTS